jgi:thiol-disulfide isomerase/thioredoxin
VRGTEGLDAIAAYGPAAIVAAIVVVRAVLVARARAPVADDATVAPPPLVARAAGLAVVAVALVGLAGNAVWSSRHLDVLAPVKRGAPAPAFTLARVDGQPGSVALAGLRGQVVVLDFWATYCAPCRIMMPTLDALHGAWGDKGVSFVGIDSENIPPESLRSFLGGHPIPYPVVADDGEVSASYHVESIPSLFVIGKDGSIRDSFVGVTAKSTVERAVTRALAER